MLNSRDSAPIEVLVLGGNGTISAAAVELALAHDMQVTVVNRGLRRAPGYDHTGVEVLTADVRDRDALQRVLADRRFDVVVDFLCYDTVDAAQKLSLFSGRVGQHIHISTASLYGKPIRQSPITESTQLHNRFIPYSRAKLEVEQFYAAAYANEGHPITIVRPSSTYDDRTAPGAGGWTTVHRMLRGAEIPVHGDGTSLWTLTHARDFAQGLVGLLDNPRAIGETVHITSDDVWTWDGIYDALGRALGVEPKLVHISSEMIAAGAPDWPWVDFLLGDSGHSAVFDNTKIRRLVPGFMPTHTLQRSLRRMVAHMPDNPAAIADPEVDAVFDRLVTGYHKAIDVFSSLAPRG